MFIGLTYDLRSDYLAAGYSAEETAEFDGVATIDAIDAALRELGHQTDRVGNGRQLVGRLAAGDRWDLVFNIAEGLRGAPARPRCRRFSTCTKSPIPSPIPLCWPSVFTRV